MARLMSDFRCISCQRNGKVECVLECAGTVCCTSCAILDVDCEFHRQVLISGSASMLPWESIINQTSQILCFHLEPELESGKHVSQSRKAPPTNKKSLTKASFDEPYELEANLDAPCELEANEIFELSAVKEKDLSRNKIEAPTRNIDGKPLQSFHCPIYSCDRSRNPFKGRSNLLDHVQVMHPQTHLTLQENPERESSISTVPWIDENVDDTTSSAELPIVGGERANHNATVATHDALAIYENSIEKAYLSEMGVEPTLYWETDDESSTILGSTSNITTIFDIQRSSFKFRFVDSERTGSTWNTYTDQLREASSPIKCNLCNKVYLGKPKNARAKLKRHALFWHSRYSCSMCHETFIEASNLDQHRLMWHREPDFANSDFDLDWRKSSYV